MKNYIDNEIYFSYTSYRTTISFQTKYYPHYPPIHEIGGFYFWKKPPFSENAENKPFGLYNILSEFNICKQKYINDLISCKKSLEIKGIIQNAPKTEQFFILYREKFNKSNFLFYRYCILVKKDYNE